MKLLPFMALGVSALSCAVHATHKDEVTHADLLVIIRVLKSFERSGKSFERSDKSAFSVELYPRALEAFLRLTRDVVNDKNKHVFVVKDAKASKDIRKTEEDGGRGELCLQYNLVSALCKKHGMFAMANYFKN